MKLVEWSEKMEDFRIGSLISAVLNSLKKQSITEFFTLKYITENEGKYDYFKYKEVVGFSKINYTSIASLLLGIFVYNPKNSKKCVESGDKYAVCAFVSRGANISDIKNYAKDLPTALVDVLSKYTSNLTDNIFDVIQQYLHVTDKIKYENRAGCLIDWCKIISDMGLNDMTYGRKFSEFQLKYGSNEFNQLNDEKIRWISEIFSACLQLSIEYSNTGHGRVPIIKTVDYLESKPNTKFDPYTVDMSYQEYFSKLTCSTALKFRLISEEDADDPNTQDCFSLPYVLGFIQKNACIIRKLQPNVIEKSLDIYVNQFQQSSEFTMRFCDSEEDIDKCLQLMFKYKDEFLPKITWRNNDYSIYKMSEKGLKSGRKWRALAYFKKYGGKERLISYVDYKQRIDGNIELGVALSNDKYRGGGLVTSIIYYHILNNFFAPIFTGTYDKNKPMKDILKNCGFTDHYIIDREKNEKSNVVKERFEVIPEPGKEPENINRYSYYYIRLPEQLKVYDALSEKQEVISDDE